MLREPQRQSPSRWNWVLWWRLDEDDVDWQAAHYGDLTLRDSFKGWSVLLLLFSVALTSVIALLTERSWLGLWLLDPAVMLTLAGFIYRGHRWAMITAMLIWTLEKISQFIVSPATIAIGILWWGVFMHAFYMAFQVERRRRRAPTEVAAFD